MGISDELTAFCLDEFLFYRHTEAERGPEAEMTPFQQARAEHEARMNQIRSAAS